MTNKLSIVIMAHPERQEWAKELSQKLQSPIVYDKINNLWDTCKRAWLSQVSVGSEYTLVLQDDSIVCDDFINKVEEILNKNDDYIFSFYAGALLGSKIDKALSESKDNVITGMIYNEVALCMKTSHIVDMVSYCDEAKAIDDHEICNWARKNKIKIFHPIPSLVDHRDTESIYKKVYNKPETRKVRKAYNFIQK